MATRIRTTYPYKPTATQRRRVMRGVAIGLTLEQLATDLGMAYRHHAPHIRQ